MSEARKVLEDFDPSRRPRYPQPRPNWVPPPPDADDAAGYLRACGSAPSKAEKE